MPDCLPQKLGEHDACSEDSLVHHLEERHRDLQFAGDLCEQRLAVSFIMRFGAEIAS